MFRASMIRFFALMAVVLGVIGINVFPAMSGSLAVLQWPGCWARDTADTRSITLSAQDAANVAVHNRPILSRSHDIAATTDQLKARLMRLTEERAAFSTLLQTQRLLCVRDANCDPARITAHTVLTSPVLTTPKSLHMVDAAIRTIVADMRSLKNDQLNLLENLKPAQLAQRRLAQFSDLPAACQALLSTSDIRRAASEFGLSVQISRAEKRDNARP